MRKVITMKKYVFEEYRDKGGIGSQKIFDGKDEAVKYAAKEWDENLTTSEKKSYFNDCCGCFYVYEIEITPEQLEEYNEGYLEISLSELETDSERPFDALRSEE